MRVFCSACGNRLDPELHNCAQCDQQFGSGTLGQPKNQVITYSLISRLFNAFPATVFVLGVFLLAQIPAAFSRLSMVFTPMGMAPSVPFMPVSPVNEVLRIFILMITVLVPILVVTVLIDLAIKWLLKRVNYPALSLQLPKLIGLGYLLGLGLVILSYIVPVFVNPAFIQMSRMNTYPGNMAEAYRYARMGGMVPPSPLMSAVGNCEVLSVKLLTWFGSDVNERDARGLTPLMLAMRRQSGAVSYNPDYTGMQSVSSCNDKTRLAIIKALIEKGADVDSTNGSPNSSPLRMAIASSDLALVKILVDAGADVDNEDYSGNTPLIQAVMAGDADIVKYLVTKGADVTHRNHEFRSAINSSSRQKGDYPEIVDILVKAGANLDDEDNNGNTVVSEAASMGNLEFLNRLFAKGAHLDKKAGAVALEKAISNRNIEMVNALIQHGADVNQMTQHGMPLLFQALDSSYEISEVLLKAGADPNIKFYPSGMNRYRNYSYNYGNFGQNRLYSNTLNNMNGISPITYVAQHGRDEMIPLLLKYHAKNDLPPMK